jgi:hypothetical protein
LQPINIRSDRLQRDRIRTGDCRATFCYSFIWATTPLPLRFVDALLAGSCRKSSDYGLYTSTTTGDWWISPPPHPPVGVMQHALLRPEFVLAPFNSGGLEADVCSSQDLEGGREEALHDRGGAVETAAQEVKHGEHQDYLRGKGSLASS